MLREYWVSLIYTDFLRMQIGVFHMKYILATFLR